MFHGAIFLRCIRFPKEYETLSSCFFSLLGMKIPLAKFLDFVFIAAVLAGGFRMVRSPPAGRTMNGCSPGESIEKEA